ncbi:MAG: Lrp/AsnC family transcriptional regulator [Thermodesulfobacteriota bacterium]|jgi:DNA-binding Lrp family transcriptional regulator
MNPMKLSAADKKLIRQIQGDLPVSPTPFAPLAQQVGLEEKEFLKRVHSFMRRGMIRRFGAILRHQKAGYRGNAMVVWKVREDQIQRVSQIMASFSAVSHCYLRPPLSKWPFNLYTMVHGRREKDCRLTAQKIAKETGLKDYRLLFSKREHKKSSMRYFEKD